MPIDPSISLQFQGTKLIDPMTMYNSVQEQRFNALRGQALQQDMARNALSMQYTQEDRARAEESRRLAATKAAEDKRLWATAMSSGDLNKAKTYLESVGRLDLADNIDKYVKGGAETRSALNDADKKKLEVVDTQLKQLNTGIGSALTPDSVYSLYKASPDALAIHGMTPDKAIAAFNQRVAEVGFDRARSEVANGALATHKQFTEELKTLETPQGTVEYRPGTEQAKPIMMGGAPIMPKPSAQQQKADIQNKQLQKNITEATTILENLVKPDSALDRATASGAGALRDWGAGFFGQATEGAIATGELEVLADPILKMIPRFEGPQSDADTTSYKQAAGQLANPKLPTAIRKKAAETLLSLFKKRKDQFGSADLPEATSANGEFEGFSVKKIEK